MEVLYAFVLAISAVSSLGSGPYLPSGWRPSGPSFLLPSEVLIASAPAATTSGPKILEAVVLPSEPTSLEDKTLESAVIPSEPTSSEFNTPESTVMPAELTSLEVNISNSTVITSESTTPEDKTTESTSVLPVETVQDDFGQETEASGSNFLREYGPPAVLDIHQSITVQGLPDLVTENTFKVDDKEDELEILTNKTGEEETATVNASAAPEEVFKQPEATVESKTSEEQVSVETDATIQAKSDQDASTEAIIEEEICEDTSGKFEGTIAEEGTTPSQSATEGSLEYEEKSFLLIKSINTEAQVTEGTSLEYLPPVLNETSQDNDAIPKDDAVALEVPMNFSDSDVVVKSEINQETQTQEEKVEESSDLGQVPDVLGEQERVGFREYGPPKSKGEDKSETERIEANETRRRRFSSRFASFNKH